MKTAYILVFALLTVTLSCGNNNQEAESADNGVKDIFESYYQDHLKLNPITATQAGDSRYNDTLPNNLSEAFLAQEKAFYTTYRDTLNAIADNSLSTEDKMTKAVLLWDCDVNLSRLNFKKYTPLDQMWSLNLQFGQ